MNSGIYTAYSGMQAQADALDILANNLANINTTGFKAEKAFFTVLQQSAADIDGGNPLQEAINRPVTVRGTFSGEEGSLISTRRNLDVAIEGNGFLVVETPAGIRYTRSGSLRINTQGILTTSDAHPVLGGENKPIVLGPGEVVIGCNGDIQLNGTTVDRLKLVRFENLSLLEKEGASLFLSRAGRDAELEADARIQAGYLEQSNVNPIQAVVQMIAILRNFEAVQKSMNLITNDINKQAIEELSR
ncbi:MAG: flagellar basal-body rod protein FlgF [Acidobacteria bacterium]|nr:flagellar basal-body rod protein FlgF [Acidobacteriota bacterium]